MIEGSPGSILSLENAADSVRTRRVVPLAGALVDYDARSTQTDTQTII